MSALAISFHKETPRTRAASVGEWLLAELDARGNTPVYIDKLGQLVISFEVYHYIDTHEPFINLSDDSLGRPHQPDIIRKALLYILDEHPARRAYKHGVWNGVNTKKVYGWRADAAPDADTERLIAAVIDDCGDASSKALQQEFKHRRPLPWE